MCFKTGVPVFLIFPISFFSRVPSGLSGGGSMVQPAISAEQGFALRPRADGKAGGE
jgi:hypothetical protein